MYFNFLRYKIPRDWWQCKTIRKKNCIYFTTVFNWWNNSRAHLTTTMFSRLFIQLRRQCQQECLKSGKCTKELTSGYHKGSSSGDKSTFWTEVLPFLIRTCQKNQVQKKASKNQDWQNFIDMVKRVERVLTPRNATEAEQVRLFFFQYGYRV